MFYAAYIAYAALTGWALLRLWHHPSLAERPFERSASVMAMTALPVALAVALTALLLDAHDAASKFVMWGAAPAALAFMAGLYAPGLSASTRLTLRVLGWSVLAGITLIPASIALFAPGSGLLALLVPERRFRMRTEDAAG